MSKYQDSLCCAFTHWVIDFQTILDQSWRYQGILLLVSVLPCLGSGSHALGWLAILGGIDVEVWLGSSLPHATLVGGGSLILAFCVPVTMTERVLTSVSFVMRLSVTSSFLLALTLSDLTVSFLARRTGAGGGLRDSDFSSFCYKR